jgi:GTPase SAR1 family protein
MENIKHIGLIGDDSAGLEMARIALKAMDAPIILIGGGKVGKTTFAQQLMENIPSDYEIEPLDLLPLKSIDLEQPKSGRENRRERRKTERKNKKL